MITELKSRYSTPRYFEKVDKNTYLVWGESHYIRGGEGYIDFEGGPFISVGTLMCNFIPLSKDMVTKITPTGREDLPNCYKLIVE